MTTEHYLRRWPFLLALALGLFTAGGVYGQRAGVGTTRGLGTSGSSGSSTRQYPNSTELGEAMITSDAETRKLIVITDDETAQHISQVVSNLDRPKPQVLIRVVFLEVTHHDSLDLGVEAKYTHKINNTTTGIGETAFGLASETSGGFYKVMSDDLEVTLRALAEAGETEVLSAPTILARNNQEAIITVGSELPFITNTRITDNGQQINTVQYQDIGIILRVTPFITSDGLVQMILAPEISTLTDQTVPISDTVRAPVIAKRSAETVLVTPDGQTVIIGGLMENNKTQNDRKIPVLGDIPLLGNLFKRRIKDKTKTELLIFLTPHVIMEPRQLAQMTEHETTKADMTRKAFSDEELRKFLDDVPMKQNNTEKPR